ncbi:serine aminopeptidase domain-containing protein [Cytobacillus massiliigabonensis]|uniref:serine aminopeptidase domain-containing protein n=1 Tax=Cytobacillus massiliigabonensis TaxID=1871011 RepID=UPI000C817F3E|nr:alpha/beta fold hydrolase [Cytobacillus massiliigabonensis]
MKKRKVVGKWVLASSIGAAAISGGISIPVQQVHAEQSVNEADFEKATKDFLALAKSQKWDELMPLLSANLQSHVSKEGLSQLWTALTSPYGAIKETAIQSYRDNGVHTKATVLLTAEKGPFLLVVNFDKNGKVDDFHTEAAYDPSQFLNPDYNTPENYTEKKMTIGEGTFSLPGVLTVPKGEGPFPVVVLVHGSGANDMDETAYAFKPFRDIAVGLANNGIAVLRYDKRTNTHAIKSSMNPKFSIMEETVLDANDAVKALKSVPEIDGDNIFVLGHSQGGYALPLILENDKEKDIKGAIGVAGPTGKFHELLIWQTEQSILRAKSMNMPIEQIKAAQVQLDVLKEQFKLLDDPQYSKDNIPPAFQIPNAYWWFDLRDYAPTSLIKEQNVPLLLLQGGKDIQVPASNLENWKTALKDRNDVQYKLYPDMMHMLVNMKGEPNGITEYMTPGNVPVEFLDDIAEWVKTGSIKETETVDLSVYKDYTPGLYWSDAFQWAVNQGIIEGFKAEKLLKPYQPMTESQYLKAFLRYKLGDELKDESLKNLYELAQSYGLQVSEEADAALSRGKAAVLLAKNFTDKDMTEEEAVQWLYAENIVNGYLDEKGHYPKTYESYKPKDTMTRAHLVTMLYRLQQ